MSPKSKHRSYVRFDDGANAIKYYNMETCKVLTSRNFRTINTPEKPSSPKHIDVTPDLPCEGESAGGTLSKGVIISDEITQKFEPAKKRK